MRTTSPRFRVATALLAALALATPFAAAAAQPDADKARALAEQAYVYGYPLLVMDASMRKLASPPAEGEPSLVNRFSHMAAFPDHTFLDVVSPNTDTLYSLAWLDLRPSPMVLELPEMGDRYYVMQLLDGWTNVFASLGTRTPGNRSGVFLIAGPGWKGEVPEGMTRVDAPTNMVWILGRTQTNGPDDYDAVHAIQARYRLTQLEPVPAAPGVPDRDPATPPERVARLDARAFFSQLNRLMADNPPAPADQPLLAELAALHIGPGLAFDPAALPQPLAAALEDGYNAGRDWLAGLKNDSYGDNSDGWVTLPENAGAYGTDYKVRAFVARFYLGANLREDAVYPSVGVDADGRPLNGRERYTIYFAPGQLPPVKAFWSITLYDDKQHLVENPLGRYCLGSKDGLVFASDGSLTLYVQRESPGPDREANWLPAAAGDCNMTLRLYWPEEAILDNAWPLPRLERQPVGLAEQAYIYGYPLVLMDETMREATAPEASGSLARINRFSHMRKLTDHTYVEVVSPNPDVLFSFAWLNLKESPVVLELPEMGERYYVMQLVDGWTNDFASLGTRTTGNRSGNFLIAGPGWQGETPRDMRRVDAATNMVWILGRTQIDGPNEYAVINALQDRYRLAPLTPAKPELNARPDPGQATPPERVEALATGEFFSRLNRLMTDNPPAADDRPLIDALAAIGIGPGRAFDLSALPEAAADAVEKGRRLGLARLTALSSDTFGKKVEGWTVLDDSIGVFGTDYIFRAFTARFGLGANVREDAVYPTIRLDADGMPLNGGKNYVLRFAAGELPPVKAFWSITLYDGKQHLVANPLGRYSIGSRNPLVFDADGGLTIFLRHASPGEDREANWLPTPDGDFNLIMRLYWPEDPILDGTWRMPRLVEDS